MSQPREELSPEIFTKEDTACHANETFGENYGSDFSVSTRLLSNHTPSADPSRHAYGVQANTVAVYDSTPPQPPPPAGWQLLLPSDQGTVDSRDHTVGYQPAPNMSLLAHSYAQPHPTAYAHAASYPLRAPPSYSAAVQQQQNMYYAGGQTSPYLRANSDFPTLKQEPRQVNMTAATQYTQDWRTSDIYSNGSTGTSKSITPSPTAEGTTAISGNSEKDAVTEDDYTSVVKNTTTIDATASSDPEKKGIICRGPEMPRASVEQEDEEEEEASNGEESSDESDMNSNQEDEKEMEPRKPKRTRTAYSNYQLDQLELVFTSTQYPDVFTREELSRRLCIKEDRIQVWFQNRRARHRKQERTGSVSFRSRYRQKRLKKLQDKHAMMQLYSPGPYGQASSAVFASPSYPNGQAIPQALPVSPHTPLSNTSPTAALPYTVSSSHEISPYNSNVPSFQNLLYSMSNGSYLARNHSTETAQQYTFQYPSFSTLFNTPPTSDK